MTALPPNNKTLTPTVRRSVALITAAIMLSSTAYAEVNIGRLPSTSVTGGQVIGAKPNLFLIIDNGQGMMIRPDADGTENRTPDGNLLQQTAGALITSLSQLEGKVRIGFSTSLPGIKGVEAYGNKCRDYKFNGNAARLAAVEVPDPNDPSKKKKLFPNLLEDLSNIPNYLLAGDDYVFDKGSGFGELTPREFRDNYARYIYAWLGAMCPSAKAEAEDSVALSQVKSHPPYADLRDKNNYKKIAINAGNRDSLPLRNNIGNFVGKGARPIIDIYARVLTEISDKDFITRIANCNTPGTACPGTLDGKDNMKKDPLRRFGTYYANYGKNSYYDAYASSTPETDGFPGTKPLSCRQNYAIIISQGPYSSPGSLKKNGFVGYGDYGFDPEGSGNRWAMPNSAIGKGLTGTFPDNEYTRMYRYLPGHGNGVTDISGYMGPQVVDRRYLFSKTAMQGYYMDLRSDLKNDVPLYYMNSTPRLQGPRNSPIPMDLDRKNDAASWQHLTVFNLGFESAFKSWQQAARYKKNYTNLSDIDGILEGYFRAIEDGSIYKDNTPYADWSRGQFGPEGGYVYRRPDDSTESVDLNNYVYYGRDEPLAEMDFAKAGINARGGTFSITDYESIKKVIGAIADRIETAMVQAVSGTGTIGGGGRVTASLQAAGGNNSALFTTYLDEEFASGNIFAYKNCPLTPEKIKNEDGVFVTNPEWEKQKCGTRLWNAATALDDGARSIANKTIFPALKSNGSLEQKSFNWQNLDDEAKAAFKLNSSDSDDLAQARVEWINGKLHADFTPALQAKLRQRPKIAIPLEGKQTRYKLDENGDPVPDADGNLTLAEATNLTNRMGDIVYASAKAVDPRGTLKASHPLNDTNYTNFIKTHIREVTSDNKVIEHRDPLVLAGSNDGRLYGFTNPKNERYAKLAFSYIPRAVITDKRLAETTKADWPTSQKSLVNGPFTVMDAQVGGTWGTYVVGTLGAGGSTVYALDISNGSATFKWEVNLDAGAANIMAEPRIVWLRKKCEGTTCPIDGKWVVLLPSGYNAADTSLVVLDLTDGSELARIKTGAQYVGKEGKCKLSPNGNTKLSADITLPNQGGVGCDNGLGPLTVTDIDNDGGADYVYAGDLLGHIWKFDLTGFYNGGMQSSDLNTALKVDYEGRPLFIAEAQDGTRQPITGMIEIGDGAYGEGSMLYFGTGRLFNQEERNLKQRQSFYAVWDVPRYYANTGAMHADLPLKRTGSTDYAFLRYEPFKLEKTALDAASILQEDRYKEIRGMRRVDVLGKNDATEIAYRSLNLSGNAAQDAEGKQIGGKVMGWILDFPADTPRERVIDRARIFENTVFLSSYEPQEGGAAESCSPQKGSIGGDGRFYMLDRLTGAQPGTPPFDFNRDGQRNDDDGAKVDVGKLGNTAGTTLAGQTGEVSVAVAGIKISSSANFTELEGELERGSRANCDYTRQVIFPGTVDPDSGNPLTLSGCYQNRYRVWKQPVQE